MPKNSESARQAMRQTLEKTHRDGLSQGAYAMAKVIHDKLTAEGKTAQEKVDDAIEFCAVMISAKDRVDVE